MSTAHGITGVGQDNLTSVKNNKKKNMARDICPDVYMFYDSGEKYISNAAHVGRIVIYR